MGKYQRLARRLKYRRFKTAAALSRIKIFNSRFLACLLSKLNSNSNSNIIIIRIIKAAQE